MPDCNATLTTATYEALPFWCDERHNPAEGDFTQCTGFEHFLLHTLTCAGCVDTPVGAHQQHYSRGVMWHDGTPGATPHTPPLHEQIEEYAKHNDYAADVCGERGGPPHPAGSPYCATCGTGDRPVRDTCDQCGIDLGHNWHIREGKNLCDPCFVSIAYGTGDRSTVTIAEVEAALIAAYDHFWVRGGQRWEQMRAALEAAAAVREERS